MSAAIFLLAFRQIKLMIKTPATWICPSGDDSLLVHEMCCSNLSLVQAEENARLQAQQNYEEMIELARQTLIINNIEFDCPICFTPVEVGEGVTLRDCLHCFCK